MRLRRIVFGLLFSSGIPAAWAVPSIDFVHQAGASRTYERVECTAKHSGGQSLTLQAYQDGGASVVKLQDLLAGASGHYKIQCTAAHADGNERYSVEFEAVKFAKDEAGSQAPIYDENRFGYGVRTSASATRSICYDPNRRIFQQQCLDAYYGTKPFYLESTDSSQDVRFKYRTEYASNVGVFLTVNPRYGAHP